MRLRELKQKEIINICTCKSLGTPVDVEFNCETARLTALIVPDPGRFCCWWWGREREYVIPWECIRQIGEDIILVEIEEEKCFRDV
nr:YlmC/YmxH family sporulation protein [uncultured Blautia sp.]